MATRPSFFDDSSVDLSGFAPKPASEQPPIPSETVRRVATEGGFPSRAPAVQPIPQTFDPWRYRTGRDTQFNTKVKPETKRGFQEIALDMRRPLGEVLELALAALQRERAAGQ